MREMSSIENLKLGLVLVRCLWAPFIKSNYFGFEALDTEGHLGQENSGRGTVIYVDQLVSVSAVCLIQEGDLPATCRVNCRWEGEMM